MFKRKKITNLINTIDPDKYKCIDCKKWFSSIDIIGGYDMNNTFANLCFKCCMKKLSHIDHLQFKQYE